MIYPVRTTANQEQLVVDILSAKIKDEGLNVYSMLVMPTFKGYVLIEADNEITLRRALTNIPHIKGAGIVKGTVKVEELSQLLEAKPLMRSIKEGQKVELVSGPFKGEKAKVLRVNDSKEEVTIKAENIKIMKD